MVCTEKGTLNWAHVQFSTAVDTLLHNAEERTSVLKGTLPRLHQHSVWRREMLQRKWKRKRKRKRNRREEIQTSCNSP